jgi:hypothetical protein
MDYKAPARRASNDEDVVERVGRAARSYYT